MASLCPAYTGSDCHLLEELPDAPWELLPPPELIEPPPELNEPPELEPELFSFAHCAVAVT